MRSVERNIGLINIRVDYHTELLGIIEIISDYRNNYPHLLKKYANRKYVEQIENKFLKFKNHKVIEMFNTLVNKHSFSYDAPVSLFLQLDENWKCEKLDDYLFEERLKKDKNIYEFINLLSDFVKEIDFESFYFANQKLYKKFISNIKKELEKYDFYDFMINYYGMSFSKKLIINLIPFQTNGNYGNNNANSVFASIGVNEEQVDEEDIYKYGDFNLSCLLYHEFSHSIINPLTDEYNLISNEDHIFDKVKERMQIKAYNKNSTILNEHIIRALTSRYIFFCNKKEVRYQRKIKEEKDKGFLYIENVINSLIEYENNRNIYKTINDFYSIVVKNIKEEHTKDIQNNLKNNLI